MRAGFEMGDRKGRGMGDRKGRGMGDRKGRGMGDRKGRPYAGLVAELFGCRGDACRRPRLSSPTLVVAHAIAPAGRAVAHAGFPMASFGSVRDATMAFPVPSGSRVLLSARLSWIVAGTTVGRDRCR